MVEINKQYEVTRSSQKAIIYMFSGIVAHREEKGKYYIKIMVGRFKKQIIPYIKLI